MPSPSASSCWGLAIAGQLSNNLEYRPRLYQYTHRQPVRSRRSRALCRIHRLFRHHRHQAAGDWQWPGSYRHIACAIGISISCWIYRWSGSCLCIRNIIKIAISKHCRRVAVPRIGKTGGTGTIINSKTVCATIKNLITHRRRIS